MISQGLVKVLDNSEIIPQIAKGWKIEEDGKRWVFDINKDIKWQNNKNISTDDLNYNFSDVEVAKTENTITFNLKEPYIPFIVLLENPIFKKGLLGTGEWRVDKLSLKGDFIQYIHLKKNGNSKLIKFYPTEEQAKYAFKMGEVNKLNNINNAKSFDGWKNVKIDKFVKYNQVIVIFFNTSDSFLSDKNFRISLNYAIDKSVFENRAISPINPESFYYNPQVKTYAYDLEKAREFLKDIKTKLPKDYVLKLISTPNLIDTADTISKMWRELGINSNILVSSVIPSDYQAFITIFDIPKDPDQYSLWHSTQSGTNITKYKNLRIDKILEDGRVEMNKEERKGIYLDFQRFLVEDSPAIFLFHPVWYNISRK